MKHSTRGAAKVSAVWLIALIVLFVVAVAFAFIAQKDMATAQEAQRVAEGSEVEATAEVEQRLREVDAVSHMLGFYDPAATLRNSNIESARQALADARDAYGLAETIDTYEKILPEVRADRQRRIQESQALEGRITELEAEVSSTRDSARQVADEKDQTIADLRQQLDDEQNNARTRQQQLEDARQRLADQVAASDQDVRDLRMQLENKDREQASAHRDWQARVKQLVADQAPFKEPYSEFTDARVLESSPTLPIGWIDVGAENRLATGTLFEVYAGGPVHGELGRGHFKGRAEVTRTEPKKAQVRFFDIVDEYDPIVSGDALVNKLYDPNVEHNAVLAGSFYGDYNEKELGLLLERIGIHVQDSADVTTHYVIVGNDVYYDDDGDPLEEPRKPTELADYREAEAQGAVIIPIADLRTYFKL